MYYTYILYSFTNNIHLGSFFCNIYNIYVIIYNNNKIDHVIHPVTGNMCVGSD